MLHWLTFSWATTPRFLMAAALGVLMCGQILWWRRRDNVLGYVLVATYAVTILVPLYGTPIVSQFDPHAVERLSRILLLGAGCYLVGLGLGGGIGTRSNIGQSATWTAPFDTGIPPRILQWSRRFGLGSLVLLAGAFALLGYVPAFAADRTSAKYGVGIYAAGAARGGAIYHIALALAGVALPVVMIMFWRRRFTRDLVLCGALLIGLLLTLSRQTAFSGPLVVVVAIAVERRWKPVFVLLMVCAALFAGTLVNEFVFPSTTADGSTPSFATRVGASAPDVHDQIGFLSGFETLGSHFVHTKTLTAGLSAKKGYYDPGGYAVRTLTLLPDASGVGSGGIRLPAPEWGYSAYGWAGVVLWSLLSGFFAGWGTVTVRRLVSASAYRPGGSLNYVLAWVFYSGTFGLLATFYFPERAGLLLLFAAMTLSYAGWTVKRRQAQAAAAVAFWEDEPPTPAPERTPGDHAPTSGDHALA
ncbi:MAG TPA: hypothetical protein VHT75_02585 [Acidimicrobiales bacterium]|nr:hypothetical protein [Acidimicrobiales bacterium]